MVVCGPNGVSCKILVLPNPNLRGKIVVITGIFGRLYRDNGKENGNCYNGVM